MLFKPRGLARSERRAKTSKRPACVPAHATWSKELERWCFVKDDSWKIWVGELPPFDKPSDALAWLSRVKSSEQYLRMAENSASPNSLQLDFNALKNTEIHIDGDKGTPRQLNCEWLLWLDHQQREKWLINFGRVWEPVDRARKVNALRGWLLSLDVIPLD